MGKFKTRDVRTVRCPIKQHGGGNWEGSRAYYMDSYFCRLLRPGVGVEIYYNTDDSTNCCWFKWEREYDFVRIGPPSPALFGME